MSLFVSVLFSGEQVSESVSGSFMGISQKRAARGGDSQGVRVLGRRVKHTRDSH